MKGLFSSLRSVSNRVVLTFNFTVGGRLAYNRKHVLRGRSTSGHRDSEGGLGISGSGWSMLG